MVTVKRRLISFAGRVTKWLQLREKFFLVIKSYKKVTKLPQNGYTENSGRCGRARPAELNPYKVL